jgi:sortase A
VGRAVGAIGRALIAAGVLVLLFVVYQLWGTNLQEARSQDELRSQLEATAPSNGTTSSSVPRSTSSTAGPGTTTTTTAPARPAPADVAVPAPGDPIGVIRIPRIGVDKVFVSGVSRTDLRKGPGHYPLTPLPGQAGNAAIAGHRTTYGAPFNRIDELEPGDEILIDAPYGQFRYEVRATTIVSPSAGEVLEDKGDDRLTLTSCNPKYSARQRIVVSAVLTGRPVGALRGQAAQQKRLRAERVQSARDAKDSPVVFGEDLAGSSPPKVPVVLWGLLCAAIWAAAWYASRELGERGQPRLVRWSPYVVGVPLFLLALYVCFENVANLLPPNF